MVEIKELIDSVLEWWKEHEYDVNMTDEDEYNVYDAEPDFVKKAMELKEELLQSDNGGK